MALNPPFSRNYRNNWLLWVTESFRTLSCPKPTPHMDKSPVFQISRKEGILTSHLPSIVSHFSSLPGPSFCPLPNTTQPLSSHPRVSPQSLVGEARLVSSRGLKGNWDRGYGPSPASQTPGSRGPDAQPHLPSLHGHPPTHRGSGKTGERGQGLSGGVGG